MGVLFITALIITADQISKSLVKSTMALYDVIPVIPGFFQLTYITNKGMAFGINLPVGISFFSGISLIITCFLVWILWCERKNNLLMRISLALILGGAIGNLIDRILFGEVVDFFDFMIGDFHWYIFNIADSAVTVGIISMLFYSFLFKPKVQPTHSIV
ncbi:MAG TPA: signal peptidase II [Candidatus Marinimicrobia bacterium]|jgi:signal peptidase II|nr:signal peptidase II [Candidatus Neomarinimicrobiota bacterium]MDP7474853.1 signal peptidase II [Candidatus Neomarinimicrobiota bacterium]HJL78620.1 signal peptidase II [Candidatus Neomarinimicrobiota bacterium]|tara:strand:+ start:2569 stop:3045 length:477 start_codon:yes stop_codon:yes gene_type:complete